MNEQFEDKSPSPLLTIDLNCDVGESTGNSIVGDDQNLIPLVSSANLACGAHGGDRRHTANAVAIAVEHEVQIGAHPSFPDRENFGRQVIKMPADKLRETILQQLQYLAEIASAQNASISYVKPHGALYHRCATDRETASIVWMAVDQFEEKLPILGLPNSEIENVCRERDSRFVREAFADRRYMVSGQLKPRSEPDAVLETGSEIASQALAITLGQGVATDFNHRVSINADSICIHGDSQFALSGLKQIHSLFAARGISVSVF